MQVDTDWTSGAGYRYTKADGELHLAGTVLEPHRLVMTFNPMWDGAKGEIPVSTVTWEIEPQGEIRKVTITHDGLDPQHPLTEGLSIGWEQILSGLKTLLETGTPLNLSGM